jgi:chromate transporter
MSGRNDSMQGGGGDRRGAWPLFLVFLRLGLTSFGGPVAHLGYYRDEFVTRRGWLGERSYADLVALCQFLPGPASSQFGMALGLSRAGYAGAFAAWAGFTLPSALALILFAIGVASLGDAIPSGTLQGLKVVAVAVVAQAVWGMARTLCRGAMRLAIMAIAAAVVLFLPSSWTPLGVIAAAGVAGLMLVAPAETPVHEPLPIAVTRRAGALWLALFVALLVALPVVAQFSSSPAVAMIDAFYRAGSLVFGGGHVVLPLLQAEVVAPGWVSEEAFLAGYGAAQAVPGPLFTFAAFLGASMHAPPNGWTGGAIALVAIFVPGFLLVAGALPFWEELRRSLRMQAALAGINAAVVGLLLAALVRPVATSAIHGWGDVLFAAVALAALMVAKLPPWLVVALCGVAGGLTAGLR